MLVNKSINFNLGISSRPQAAGYNPPRRIYSIQPLITRKVAAMLVLGDVNENGKSRLHPTRWKALSFHRTSGQPAHEIALQREEDDQRDEHRDEGARGKHMPVLASFSNQGCQA